MVDDGGHEPVEPAVSDLRTKLDLSVHRQDPAGLNAARTAGIARTRGEWIAFLDDDVVVEEDWPEGMRSAFASGLAIAAGRTVADPEAPIPGWISPEKLLYISVLDLGGRPGLLGFATPVGANLGVARAWIERAGGFRTGLDRTGSSLLSGGDTDLVRRIRAAGGRVEYWPAATVRHRITAERLTKAWFRRRALAQGVSDVRMSYADGPPGAAVLAREAVRPLRAVGIAAKRVVARRDPIDAELWLWSSRGRWRELRRSRRGTRRCASCWSPRSIRPRPAGAASAPTSACMRRRSRAAGHEVHVLSVVRGQEETDDERDGVLVHRRGLCPISVRGPGRIARAELGPAGARLVGPPPPRLDAARRRGREPRVDGREPPGPPPAARRPSALLGRADLSARRAQRVPMRALRSRSSGGGCAGPTC